MVQAEWNALFVHFFFSLSSPPTLSLSLYTITYYIVSSILWMNAPFAVLVEEADIIHGALGLLWSGSPYKLGPLFVVDRKAHQLAERVLQLPLKTSTHSLKMPIRVGASRPLDLKACRLESELVLLWVGATLNRSGIACYYAESGHIKKRGYIQNGEMMMMMMMMRLGNKKEARFQRTWLHFCLPYKEGSQW